MDRLEAMALFAEAAERGSLTAAGRKFGMPLPTVSRKISDLEAHLGARLLVRSTRSLNLTEAGSAYLREARRILDLVGEAERAASGEYEAPRGDLAVTAPVTFGRLHVLPIVTEFLDQYPEINVRLTLSDRNLHLAGDHVDMAVRIGALPDSGMAATRVGSVRHIVCASPHFLARHAAPQRPADLEHLPCVSHDPEGVDSAWVFRKPGARAGARLAIRPRLSVTTAEAAADAAIAGLGCARLVSYQVAAAVAKGQLVLLLEDFAPEPMPVSLLHVSRGVMPLKMRRFLAFAAPRLRAGLAIQQG